MNPFSFSFNAVAPILVMVLLGIFLYRIKAVDDDLAAKLNRICFSLFVPMQVFKGVYRTNLKAVVDTQLLVFTIVSTLIVIGLACALVPRVIKGRPSQGAFIQGIFRGNIALIGLSLMTGLYGSESAGLVSLVIALTIILYNASATYILLVFSGEGKISGKNILKKIVTNPYLISCTLGLIIAYLQPPLAGWITKSVDDIAGIGTPLALIALGASLRISDVRKSGLLALAAGLIRQAVIPAVVIGVALLLGFRDERLGVIFCIFASPTAVGSYVLAKNMHSDHVLAGQILLMTTLLSFFTMMIGLTLLRSLGFL